MSGMVDFTSLRVNKTAAARTDDYGNKYQPVRIYRYSDLSGWNWPLYHNLNRPPIEPDSALTH